MARRDPIWEPPAEIAAKMPADLSGNTVNGLGEAQPRPPTPIMWHHPKRVPAFAAIQGHVNESYEGHPLLTGAFDTPERRNPPAPIAEVKAERSPEDWVQVVKDYALAHEADLVGIAPVDQNWVFEGFEVTEPWIIVLGVYMDHGELARAPEPEAAAEVARQYNRGNRAARSLADWIRGQGWKASGHGGPGAGPIQLVPSALAAGLGELGKHGSIINRTYGSSFRLAGVVTDLPLIADAPAEFGAADFCTSCQVCTNACPPAAITPDRKTVRGVQKWYVDFDRCMPYFAANYGCGICIAVCPWSRPGTAPRLAERMLQRRARKSDAADAA
ncbi:MAG: 4Fe-4S dicluster domain-containing protein [Bauldia litoralis]